MFRDVVEGTAALWTDRRPLLAVGLVFTLVVVFLSQTIRYNPTPSIPLGFYYKEHLPIRPDSGRRVLVCLSGFPARLAIRRGYVPEPVYALDCTGRATDTKITAIAKHLLAVPGDTVRLDTTGLYIGGRQVSGPPPVADSRGQPVFPYYGTYALGKREYWIGSAAQLAYDSRYFGPVRRRQIVAGIRSLWTWPGRLHALQSPPESLSRSPPTCDRPARPVIAAASQAFARNPLQQPWR